MMQFLSRWIFEKREFRTVVLAIALELVVQSSLRSETLFDSRYQFYAEDHQRIRVDSNYSLFSLDLRESLSLDGSFLYSSISGASPYGIPPLVKGGSVPVVEMKDQRTALTLGVTRTLQDHVLKFGYSYSDESDYRSGAYSLVDTISFNQKNTELVLGAAYTSDTVEANGSSFKEPKRSYDGMIGVNQVLGPNDLLSVNFTLGLRQGYLGDPYKWVVINGNDYELDKRPGRKLEQLLFFQWTHYISPLRASLETSYRYGHNDWGSHSSTVRVAVFKKLFEDRLIISPSIRYYRQTAAQFYSPDFSGAPNYYSSDYRLSAEQTLSFGAQIRWFAVKDKLSVDLGYERYQTRGMDHETSQSAYPSAHCVSAGFHYQF